MSGQNYLAFAPAPPGKTSRRGGRRRLVAWGAVLAALAVSVGLLLVSRERAAEQLRGVIEEAAAAHGLDARLVEAVVDAESGGNPRAVSPKKAYGLMQLRLPTAIEMAGRPLEADDLFDPRLNLDLGCRYLSRMLDRYAGDVRLALMAYNAGPGNVSRWLAETRDPDEILAEHAFGATRAYVRKILTNVGRG